MIGWLAAQEDEAPPDPPNEILTHMINLGLIRQTNSEGSRDHAITTLGRHLIESAERGGELDERLEELERLRTEFLATVAHELRTPLTAVRTSVGLLMDPNIHADPETHQALLHNISSSADRMQQLVNDLLDLARFRSGQLHLDVRPFDARQVARAAVDAMGALLREKRQTVDLSLPKRALRVAGHKWRLEQALINLMSNASKFSPDGSTIGLVVRSADDHVEWIVSDQGSGIASEDMGHLFERFFTRRRDTSGASAGVGLGLPIALAIAQAHGGTIVPDSRMPQGSTFTLRIPKRSGSSSD